VAALGYGHPSWTKAVSDQVRNLNFQSNAVPLDVRLRAARKLIAFSRLPVESVFFINSGAEANENALKMAFRMTRRPQVVIALEQSFHGRTAGAGALTWANLPGASTGPRAPFDVRFIPRRDPAAIQGAITRATAAVFVEPVQGVGGAFDLGAEYLAALRRRGDEVGALLAHHLLAKGRTGVFACSIVSATLLRAIAPGGAPVRGVDTHGLAQRGGIVVSQLRVGARAHNPASAIPTGRQRAIAA